MSENESELPREFKEESNAAASLNLLSESSKERYEKEYDDFKEWLKINNIYFVDENVMLTYAKDKSAIYTPNTLWNKITMLKLTLKVRDNIDIGTFGKLLQFLKTNNENYKPKKARVLSEADITKFLINADDYTWLLEKVILLFGIFGACRRHELVSLNVDDFDNTENNVLVTLRHTKNKKRRAFIIPKDGLPFNAYALYKQYADLRPPNMNTRRFFIGFRNGKCIKQVVGIHTIGSVPKKVATFLKLKNPELYTGHTFKRSSSSMLVENGGEQLSSMEFGGYIEEMVSKTTMNISHQLRQNSAVSSWEAPSSSSIETAGYEMEGVYVKTEPEPIPHASTSEPPSSLEVPLEAQPCRVCANIPERAIEIYSTEGLSNQLSDRINEYLPIKVSPDDKLPLCCCWTCVTTLLSFHELVLTCMEAEKRLQVVLIEPPKPIAIPIPAVPDPEQSQIPEYNDDDMEMMDADDGDGDDDYEPENDDEDEESEEETKPIPGTSDDIEAMAEWDAASLNAFCESALSKNGSGPEISKSKISARSRSEEPTEDDSNIEKLLKEKGGEVSDVVGKLGNAESREYKYLCEYCSAEFVCEEEAVVHLKSAHSAETEGASVKKERRKHTKIDQELINNAKVVVEGKIYYNCKTCGKSLHSPYTYIWHMRIHTGERPFVCDLCGKQFRVSQGLVRHLKETHEGIKNYPCDLCGRMFATRRNVEEHRRIHTNERPYICDLCGKAFKQKASLFVHNRSHTNYFPFRCTYCNQGFRTRPTLLIHVTRHTGEKPYPCDVCGRRFRIKYELKRHKLIHSEEKPFSCDECGVTFRQKRYLRNHTKSNHNREIT